MIGPFVDRPKRLYSLYNPKLKLPMSIISKCHWDDHPSLILWFFPFLMPVTANKSRLRPLQRYSGGQLETAPSTPKAQSITNEVFPDGRSEWLMGHVVMIDVVSSH